MEPFEITLAFISEGYLPKGLEEEAAIVLGLSTQKAITLISWKLYYAPYYVIMCHVINALQAYIDHPS